MAYAPHRSQNKELEEGMTDATYKKVVQNRGGFPEAITAETRRQLDDVWHGIHEIQPKITPDGLVADTPNYVPTEPARQV